MPESPPPSYSPRRPPPPYEEQNNRNAKKESGMATEHTYKVSPPPFVPLSPPTAIDVDQLQVIISSNPSQPTVIIASPPKPAPSFASFETTCYNCGKPVHTLPKFVVGALTWIVFVLVLICFFPLAFVPFCLDSCKDVHHYCPRCNAILGIKKRIF